MLAYALSGAAAWAQVKARRAMFIGDVTCNASNSAGVELAPRRDCRQSILISNNSGSSVRLGFNLCSSCTITSSNGHLFVTGRDFFDSYPSVFVGRISCAGISTSSPTLSVSEFCQ